MLEAAAVVAAVDTLAAVAAAATMVEVSSPGPVLCACSNTDLLYQVEAMVAVVSAPLQLRQHGC